MLRACDEHKSICDYLNIKQKVVEGGLYGFRTVEGRLQELSPMAIIPPTTLGGSGGEQSGPQSSLVASPLGHILHSGLREGDEGIRGLRVDIVVLTCLRFLAKGDYLSETTDIHGISKSSGCLAVHRVVDAVCKALRNIEFPTSREHNSRIKASFYKNALFPNVIGAIECTQIPIQGIGTDDEHLYVCRKGLHSINVQAVVDADLRFTNAVCKFPGATHDTYILQNSSSPNFIENLHDGGRVIGDS
ncbi:putative nuclease HARBI1 [Magallana gigas]|uniref:putative nuclease HARBI1 n=1 Tax=Magallana gigas TaxID=29159 RepID=UPI003340759C